MNMFNQSGVCMSPSGTERAVMRGLSAKAPSSAHFSTSQSLLLADRVVQATATSHLGPSNGTCSKRLLLELLRKHLATQPKHTKPLVQLGPAARLQRRMLCKHKQSKLLPRWS